MIVVSDTSPLHYLVLIEAIDVLPRLYGDVFIPPAVAAELSHAGTPASVRAWFAGQPAWVKLQGPQTISPINGLDPGEVEAIALALEINADRLLIDDRAGKNAAKNRGIDAVGTLAVLDAAATLGLVDFHKVILKVILALETQTNFRMSRSLRDRLLPEHAGRSVPDPTPNDVTETDPRNVHRTGNERVSASSPMYGAV